MYIKYLLPLCAIVLSACLKDGKVPPRSFPEGPVDLSLELVRGTAPFDMDEHFLDGADNRIRITEIKGYLTGIHLHDDDGREVSDFSEVVLLFDGRSPTRTYPLGAMADGHIHDIHFTAGLDREFGEPDSYPVDHPLADQELYHGGSAQRIHLLMEGYVDRDLDDHFDPTIDLPFSYRPRGAELMRDRHLHVHADMVDGETVTLGLLIDVRFLLLGMDLEADPVALDDHPQAVMLMNNMAAAVSVRY